MKKFALVTGASSGIGLQICHSLAKRGFNIILTSLSEKTLKSISEKISSKYEVETNYFPCDLADKQGPQNIFNFCESKKYQVDILINNAGYALPHAFEKNSVEDEEKCIRVLATSVISLTKLFVRDMIKNNTPATKTAPKASCGVYPIPAQTPKATKALIPIPGASPIGQVFP